MIAVIDYGMSNIQSVVNALDYLQVPHTIVTTPEAIAKADKLLLPGVGNFKAGMQGLSENSCDQAIIERVGEGIPIMGICLGMQMLADYSLESEKTAGLGLIPGQVVRLEPDEKNLKVPHMGWSTLVNTKAVSIFEGITANMEFYFVHSYFFDCDEQYQLASFNYGGEFTAAVANNHIVGTQFHPEKSQKQGLHILNNFADM